MRIFIMVKRYGTDSIGNIIQVYEKNGWSVLNIKFRREPLTKKLFKTSLPKKSLELIKHSEYRDDEVFRYYFKDNRKGPFIFLELENSNSNTTERAIEIMHDLRRSVHPNIKIDILMECTDTEEETNRLIDLWFK